MAKEIVQLAHNYDPKKHKILGWLASEKLDGMRAFWDGGVTRGKPKASVPWAKTDKDARYKVPPISTGLWSRLGNVINAPDWWLDQLPKSIPLDGELYTTRSSREALMSAVKKLVPIDEEWLPVKYHVFDLYNQPGEYQKNLALVEQLDSGIIIPVPQRPVETMDDIDTWLESVVADGGEGLIVRNPEAYYTCKRSHNLLKVKPAFDSEGVVTGYKAGKGKYVGMLGCLTLAWQGLSFDLSGFTDAERALGPDAADWAAKHPGAAFPQNHISPHFPPGTIVTFKYRTLSAYGVPSEARYWRVRGA